MDNKKTVRKKHKPVNILPDRLDIKGLPAGEMPKHGRFSEWVQAILSDTL